MKKYLSVLFLLVASMLLSVAITENKGKTVPSYAAQDISTVNITVTGVGEVSAVPDTAVISMGIQITESDLKIAKDTVNQRVNSLVEALSEYGIDKQSIQTKHYNIYPQFDYKNGSELIGYVVSNMLELRTKKLSDVSDIISMAMDEGANNLNSVSFILEDTSAIYEQALLNAMQNASSKAQIILGGREAKASKINEKSIYNNCYDTMSFAKGAMEATVFHGHLIIKAVVEVDFVA